MVSIWDFARLPNLTGLIDMAAKVVSDSFLDIILVFLDNLRRNHIRTLQFNIIIPSAQVICIILDIRIRFYIVTLSG